jgi:FkbM family methyltransferase
MIAHRVRNSLYERARYFVARTFRDRLAAEQGVAQLSDAPLELLETMASLRSMLPLAPDVLIDIGAHVGAFAAAADAFFDLQTIFAFEPDADLLAAIRDRLPAEKLRLFDVALADAAGEQGFFVHPVKSMSSLVPVDGAALQRTWEQDDPARIETRAVRTARLDEVLTAQALSPTRGVLLKVDTQGNELSVLRGAAGLLPRIDACLVEYMFKTPYLRTYGLEDLLDLLRGHEFHCASVLSLTRQASHEITAVDFLFVANRHRSAPTGAPAPDGRANG